MNEADEAKRPTVRQQLGLFTHSPAVDHNRPGVLGVAILHFFEELEHANRSEGHSEVWPACEMELSDEPLRFLSRHVSHLRGRSNRCQSEMHRQRGATVVFLQRLQTVF